MVQEGMTRRRFLTKAAAASLGFTALGLGVQCGATSAPEVAEVAATDTPAVKDSPTPEWKAPERILFVGNSLSYHNDGVETHLKTLAASADPAVTIETSTAYIGGATFERHWNDDSTMEAIRKGGWDVVVLQGEAMEALHEDQLYEYARKLDKEIKKVGGHTVFFMPWAMMDETGRVRVATEIQQRVYESAGAELGAQVAPVGLAWERLLQDEADLDVYEDDGVHPSIYGTYLTACVFYATLFGESPVGLPYTPVWIADEEGAVLQRIAWETVAEYE